MYFRVRARNPTECWEILFSSALMCQFVSGLSYSPRENRVSKTCKNFPVANFSQVDGRIMLTETRGHPTIPPCTLTRNDVWRGERTNTPDNVNE